MPTYSLDYWLGACLHGEVLCIVHVKKNLQQRPWSIPKCYTDVASFTDPPPPPRFNLAPAHFNILSGLPPLTLGEEV